MSLRIAVVQQNGDPGKPEENRAKALEFAAQALAQKAEVILFQEGLLLGYTPAFRQLAEPVDGATTRAFQRLLRGRASLVIYGLTEKDGKRYFISAPVVSAGGVIANYRKTHLWWKAEDLRQETKDYRPGAPREIKSMSVA